MRYGRHMISAVVGGRQRPPAGNIGRRGMQKLPSRKQAPRASGVYRSDIMGGWELYRMEWHQKW